VLWVLPFQTKYKIYHVITPDNHSACEYFLIGWMKVTNKKLLHQMLWRVVLNIIIQEFNVYLNFLGGATMLW